jgi:Enoyl-(Acyl carrier protein) reductase
MIGLTKAVALEAAGAGITCNAVAPGWIETGSSADQERSAGKLTPVGRGPAPEEVTAVIAFLASPEASFLTGQMIVIDGGKLASGRSQLAAVNRRERRFAVCEAHAGLPIDLDDWLGDMADALVHMELDEMYPDEVSTDLASGNWKSSAGGYLDGYHLGYLHSRNLGLKQINNRNTTDLYGPRAPWVRQQDHRGHEGRAGGAHRPGGGLALIG